uniref:Uncharacterized protein n=1 Tax=viral metagenome TaxID=1070528 RepID=A0A6C0B3I0_9ZZZZ
MKFNAQYVIPIVILVVVVFISLCQSCAYFKPYDSEGYENIQAPLNVGEVNDSDKNFVTNGPNQAMDSALEPEVYDSNNINNVGTPIPGSGMLYNTMNQGDSSSFYDDNSINNMGTPIPESGMLYNTMNQAASAPVIRTTFSGREGFATLNDVSGDYAKGDKGIDIYSQAEGAASCEPGPYSNSNGYLCLDDNQLNQLKTRGGNQTAYN